MEKDGEGVGIGKINQRIGLFNNLPVERSDRDQQMVYRVAFCRATNDDSAGAYANTNATVGPSASAANTGGSAN